MGKDAYSAAGGADAYSAAGGARAATRLRNCAPDRADQSRFAGWMILKEAFILLAAGVVLGGALLYATMKFIQGMLYRISAFDSLTLLYE
jgi:hypothetical protein